LIARADSAVSFGRAASRAFRYRSAARVSALAAFLERREVQGRRELLDRWRRHWPAAVGDRREHTLFDLTIAFAHFVLPLLEQRLQLAHVGLRRVGQMRELKRQHVGLSEPDDERADRLRERAAVGEVGIQELREVIVVVVDRVIDAVVAIETAERQVERRDAGMLQEG
jgi:hypothetical protein